MRILFLHPVARPIRPLVTGYDESLATVSALLKDRGHHVALFQSFSVDAEGLEHALDEHQPELLFMSVDSRQMARARRFAQRAAELRPEARLFLIGPHPSAAVEQCLGLEEVRGVFVGEYEAVLPRFTEMIVGQENHFQCPNFCFRLEGKIYRNETAPLLDVTELPLPDRTIFPLQLFIDQNPTLGAEFYAHRGAPHDQIFFPAVRQNACYREFGGVVRSKTVDQLLDEIAGVLRHYERVPLVGFQDESFPQDPAWIEEFAAKYPLRIGVPFWCYARADQFDEGAARLLAQAGCVRVQIPVESGNSYLRNIVLRRFMPRYQIINAFRNAAQAGIKAVSCSLVGLPYENEDMIVETIKLNRLVAPHWVLVRLFDPLPGTSLHHLCRQKGWLPPREPESMPDDPDDLSDERVFRLRSPWIKRKQLEFFAQHFRDLIYAQVLRLPWEMEKEEQEYVLYDQ